MLSPSPDLLNLWGHELAVGFAAACRSHQLKRDDFPGLTSDSGTERWEALAFREGLGRVNLPATLKKFMKERFAAYAFDHSLGDWHHFKQKISDRLSLSVEFERIHHQGRGKTFTVYIGAALADAAPQGRFGFRKNLMSFFDRSSMDWTYGSLEDLNACLEEVATLLEIALPLHETAWRATSFEQPPPANTFTFRQAAELACRHFHGIYPQFSTLGHTSWMRSRASVLPGGTWAISFYDNAADRALRIDVLPSGKLLYALGNQTFIRRDKMMNLAHPRRYVDEHLALPAQPHPSSTPSTPWEPFLDSPRTLEIANKNGGADFASTCSDFSMHMQFHAQRADPPAEDEEWRVIYSDPSPTRRHLYIRMSARSGVVL